VQLSPYPSSNNPPLPLTKGVRQLSPLGRGGKGRIIGGQLGGLLFFPQIFGLLEEEG